MAAAMTSHHQKVGPRLFFYVLLLIADSVCGGGNPCWEVHSTVNEFALDFFFFFAATLFLGNSRGPPSCFKIHVMTIPEGWL